MIKKSLIAIFVLTFVYTITLLFIKPSNPFLTQALALVYFWFPGLVALFFAKQEGTKIPIFAKPNRFFFFIPLATFSIGILAFFFSSFFGGASAPNQLFANQGFMTMFGYAVLFFFTSYIFSSVLLAVFAMGGELYWRGYFWQKMKDRGALKTIWLTAFIWSIWQFPIILLTGGVAIFQNFFLICILNFAFSPVLTYFRVKTGAVYGSTFCYSSMISVFLYFLILFPQSVMSVSGYFILFIALGLIGLSLLLRLYSPAKWKNLV